MVKRRPKRVVLISCASKKAEGKRRASDLYISPLFAGNLRYAHSLLADSIFILSAKYGLLDLDRRVAPYDLTLKNMSSAQVRLWAERVLWQLKQRADLRRDHFIFLAGERYRKYVVPHLSFCEIPFEGMGIGKQLHYLQHRDVSRICSKVHRLFSRRPRFRFPFDSSRIPNNGIYVLFEDGEQSHQGDRIVRIGTHTGDDQLPSRLEQHFLKANKDRSIFRKNIGRALLNRDSDPFLSHWEIDLTSARARKKHGKAIDRKQLERVERRVTRYIRKSFSFAVFAVEEKTKRLFLESKLISTLSLCDECRPSKGWLGLYSPKDKIRKSGLWLVNQLYKKPLSEKDFKDLEANVASE